MSRGKRALSRYFSVLTGLALLLSFVVSDVAQVRAATDCTVTDKLVNPCHPWLGARSNSHPAAANDLKSQTLYHEKLIGRQLDIMHDYAQGGGTLSSTDVYFATRPGTTLFENYKPASNWAEAGGGNATVNANIDKMAASVKALGSTKIFMTIWHEPENDLGSDSNCRGTNFKGPAANTVAAYKKMWQNVQSRFAAKGVTNVVWAVDYMNYPVWACVVPDLYPGDNLVDWIVFNGYDQGAGDWNNVVSRFYDFLTTNSTSSHDYLSKPWGIVEWEISNSTQAQAYSYYDQVKAALDANTFPNLHMYMAFDSPGPQNGAPEMNIELNTNGVYDQTEVNHYKALANDPVFTNAIPPLPDDTTPPVARIDGPTDQSVVNGVVPVTGSATDDTGVISLQLLVDGSPYPVAGTAPFDTATINWDSTGVVNGEHTLQFVATDAAGNVGTSSSATVSVNNPDIVAPAVPTNVQTEVLGSATVQLSWDASSDDVAVTGYNVYRDGALLASVTDGSTSYTDSGLSDSALYQYSVSAIDASGNESEQSSPISVMIQDTEAPTVPTGLTATPGDTQVALNWQASTDNVGVTAYDIMRDGAVVATVDGDTTVYTDTGVSQGQTYSYAIAARDIAGNASAASDSQSVTVPDTTPPSAPQSLLVSNNGTDVNLSWQASTDNVGVASYNVLRGGVVIGTSTTTSYIDTTGQQGQTYLYTVQAVDAAGNASDASLSQTCSVPDVTAPGAPGKPAVGLTGDKTGVVVNWTAATDNVGVTHYAVWRNGVEVAQVSGTTLTYVDTVVNTGSSYTYTIYALDAAGNVGTASLASDSINIPAGDTSAPTVPSVTAWSPSAKTAKVWWDASTDNIGVAGYYVYQNGVKIATVDSSTLQYYVNGLTTGTYYHFTAQAFDAAGNVSAMSNQTTIKAK